MAARGDVKRSLEQIACCERHPNALTVSGPVRINVYGQDRHCVSSSDQILAPLYVAKCRKLRREGLCGYQRTGG